MGTPWGTLRQRRVATASSSSRLLSLPAINLHRRCRRPSPLLARLLLLPLLGRGVLPPRLALLLPPLPPRRLAHGRQRHGGRPGTACQRDRVLLVKA